MPRKGLQRTNSGFIHQKRCKAIFLVVDLVCWQAFLFLHRSREILHNSGRTIKVMTLWWQSTGLKYRWRNKFFPHRWCINCLHRRWKPSLASLACSIDIFTALGEYCKPNRQAKPHIPLNQSFRFLPLKNEPAAVIPRARVRRRRQPARCRDQRLHAVL